LTNFAFKSPRDPHSLVFIWRS